MSEWLPIESAPKDGTWIVGLSVDGSVQDDSMPKPFVFTTRWVKEIQEHWERVSERRQELVESDWSHWEGYERPTHWQPLPAAPLNEATKQGEG